MAKTHTSETPVARFGSSAICPTALPQHFENDRAKTPDPALCACHQRHNPWPGRTHQLLGTQLAATSFPWLRQGCRLSLIF